MKNFTKVSREKLKEVKGGEPVYSGGYACCIGNECSRIVHVQFYDDLYCIQGDLQKIY